jgi:hypothetical protein
MIDRDKDPCASKQQDVVSQRQVTGYGIKNRKPLKSMEISVTPPSFRRLVFESDRWIGRWCGRRG